MEQCYLVIYDVYEYLKRKSYNEYSFKNNQNKSARQTKVQNPRITVVQIAE